MLFKKCLRKKRNRRKRKIVAFMALNFNLVWFSPEKTWMPHLVHLPFMCERTELLTHHGVTNHKGFATSRTNCNFVHNNQIGKQPAPVNGKEDVMYTYIHIKWNIIQP